ncbi:SDR family oxidoreductase [Falsiroseomonas oryziterrae]|uniref:SDR family oxidoreductase n=1 Tax=Falsiroseomonas oryziterrae TaxID=2911368 RepID=UPI0035561F00
MAGVAILCAGGGNHPGSAASGCQPIAGARDAGASAPATAADEVARLVLCVASEEASYVTGAEVAIDGGWTA